MMNVRRIGRWLPGVLLLAALTAGSGVSTACRRDTAAPPPPQPAGDGGASRSPARVVFLGDSLTAGYGLPADQAYPALLDARLRASGFAVTVVNAGVSGDTSAGGLRRLDWSLDGDVRVLVVALGGNDALRGLSVEDLRQNLAAIIERAHDRRVRVVLAGMEAPPNLGPLYTRAFRHVYRDLADRYDVALLPFLLDGVAGIAGLNQPDGIHPNAEGARRVAENVWPYLESAVRATVTP